MDVICVKGIPAGRSDIDRFETDAATEADARALKDGIESAEEYYCTEFYIRFSRVVSSETDSATIFSASTVESSTIMVRASSAIISHDNEFVDVYCNNRSCGLNAIVGQDHLVNFLDPISQCPVTTPTSDMLRLFNLQKGKNKVVCKHRGSDSYKEFFIWLYEPNDKFLIMDIDGTITKSNVTGYFQTVYLGVFTYIHDGLTPFLNSLTQTFRLNVIYLTSRPISHQRETRNLLGGIAAEHGHEMPDGPLFMNKESVSQALYREVVSRQSVQYKHGVLVSVAAIFKEAGSLYRVPFALGIGNTENDAIAYNSAGMNSETILIIDKSSTLSTWKHLEEEKRSVAANVSKNNLLLKFHTYRDKNLFKYIALVEQLNFS